MTRSQSCKGKGEVPKGTARMKAYDVNKLLCLPTRGTKQHVHLQQYGKERGWLEC